MKKVIMIVDLQFGSTGKGLIAGYLAENYEPDTVVTANMPNAGHTYINKDGRKWVHKVLPNGIVSPGLKRVMIGPGAVFSIDRLLEEMEESADLLEGKEIMIHPNAVVLTAEHRATEEANLSRISSTMQGSGAALVSKIMRDPLAIAANAALPLKVRKMVCTHDEWNYALMESEMVLAEAAQGFSLGVHSRFYPYTTSRECTPSRFLSDMAIPHKMLMKVVGCARVHPIRVGNTEDGFSGEGYSDQRELSWEEVGVEPETTTVTGRIRRVFTFSRKQIAEAMFHTCADEVFLNFCNYDPDAAAEVAKIIDDAGAKYCKQDRTVRYYGWGPAITDVRERW